jgi:glutamate-ammonia-ligase adenylyltransferase
VNDTIAKLAALLGESEFQSARDSLGARAKDLGVALSPEALDLGAALATGYPALFPQLLAWPSDLPPIARGMRVARDARAYRKTCLALMGDMRDEEQVRRGLRVFARRERLRVAARELLHPGVDVDTTARELSDLADVTIDVALSEARLWADARFGLPTKADGAPCAFVVFGMGKLGGRELNCGSDVDLLLFYETDDGEVVSNGVPTDLSLHEYFTRVARRLTATLADVTDDGFVWRVDLRLRPEGAQGPLVNALAAAERYYESWGRTWERGALLRARPCAGDLALGADVQAALAPFVWRREVNPMLAAELRALALRARAELSRDASRDLKLGPGGIREVQSLQLIWGGREPRVRTQGTLESLRRLRSRGLVTDREARSMSDAYLFLRRLEHRVQFATMVQTHELPQGALLEVLSLGLGFASGAELEAELHRVTDLVARGFASLSNQQQPTSHSLDRLLAALDHRDEALVLGALPPSLEGATPDFARHLLSLSRHPDAPLGASSRDKDPALCEVLLGALAEAADPEQAARLLSAFFARLVTPGVYTKSIGADERVVRRVVGLFGASLFLGEALVGHPELVDRLIFSRAVPNDGAVRSTVTEELGAIRLEEAEGDPFEEVAGALRRAKASVTLEVGLADLAGEITTKQAMHSLSALADAVLEAALSWVTKERGVPEGLAVIAMGKLGGKEIGYGSDLDLVFVYEGEDQEDAERFVRCAQRVMRLLSMPHGDGPGYELDTRLRPSGNQGLLVVSLSGFGAYHGVSQGSVRRAEDWERQALLRARVCAGDARVGERFMKMADEVAYEGGPPAPQELHRLRMRMQHELGRERKGALYDLKFGVGGVVDIEFCTQFLQMKYGGDHRVRTTDTETALLSLEACGYLDAHLSASLREGYRFLRSVEQRLRVLHGTSAHLLERGAPGLVTLARGLGVRERAQSSAASELLVRYELVTKDVRAAYGAVLGVPVETA